MAVYETIAPVVTSGNSGNSYGYVLSSYGSVTGSRTFTTLGTLDGVTIDFTNVTTDIAAGEDGSPAVTAGKGRPKVTLTFSTAAGANAFQFAQLIECDDTAGTKTVGGRVYEFNSEDVRTNAAGVLTFLLPQGSQAFTTGQYFKCVVTVATRDTYSTPLTM